MCRQMFAIINEFHCHGPTMSAENVQTKLKFLLCVHQCVPDLFGNNEILAVAEGKTASYHQCTVGSYPAGSLLSFCIKPYESVIPGFTSDRYTLCTSLILLMLRLTPNEALLEKDYEGLTPISRLCKHINKFDRAPIQAVLAVGKRNPAAFAEMDNGEYWVEEYRNVRNYPLNHIFHYAGKIGELQVMVCLELASYYPAALDLVSQGGETPYMSFLHSCKDNDMVIKILSVHPHVNSYIPAEPDRQYAATPALYVLRQRNPDFCFPGRLNIPCEIVREVLQRDPMSVAMICANGGNALHAAMFAVVSDSIVYDVMRAHDAALIIASHRATRFAPGSSLYFDSLWVDEDKVSLLHGHISVDDHCLNSGRVRRGKDVVDSVNRTTLLVALMAVVSIMSAAPDKSTLVDAAAERIASCVRCSSGRLVPGTELDSDFTSQVEEEMRLLFVVDRIFLHESVSKLLIQGSRDSATGTISLESDVVLRIQRMVTLARATEHRDHDSCSSK